MPGRGSAHRPCLLSPWGLVCSGGSATGETFITVLDQGLGHSQLDSHFVPVHLAR